MFIIVKQFWAEAAASVVSNHLSLASRVIAGKDQITRIVLKDFHSLKTDIFTSGIFLKAGFRWNPLAHNVCDPTGRVLENNAKDVYYLTLNPTSHC